MPHIKLVQGKTSHDINLIGIVLDNHIQAPLFGQKSVCYYNNTQVTDTGRFVGERGLRRVCWIDPNNEQLDWDGRYTVSLSVSSYNGTFDGWDGHIELFDDYGKEIAKFNTSDLGDLTETRAITMCIAEPIKKKSTGFLGLFSTDVLPITGSITKYNTLNLLFEELDIV